MEQDTFTRESRAQGLADAYMALWHPKYHINPEMMDEQLHQMRGPELMMELNATQKQLSHKFSDADDFNRLARHQDRLTTEIIWRCTKAIL